MTINSYSLNERRQLAQLWLQSIDCSYQIGAYLADASFRRYWHLYEGENATNVLLMDCPPGKEDLSQFIYTAGLLAKNRLWKIPRILAENTQQGFALIEFFGDRLLCNIYAEKPSAQPYISFALRALVGLQTQGTNKHLNHYDAVALQTEMDLFVPWFVEKYCTYQLSDQEKQDLKQCQYALINNMLAQAQVIVHRDYHCRNLLLVASTHSSTSHLTIHHQALGVIDFQDALNGPITYDVVSLIKDCYWRLPVVTQQQLLKSYWHEIKNKHEAIPSWIHFQRDFDYSGIQRHLKVLGVFARLGLYYEKKQYLENIPLVLWHLRVALERYPLFNSLNQLIKRLMTQTKNLQIKMADE